MPLIRRTRPDAGPRAALQAAYPASDNLESSHASRKI